MSANGGPPATAWGVLSIPELAQSVVDDVLVANNNHPVELWSITQRNEFFDSIRPLIPLGLQEMASTRRWIVVRFIDYQRMGSGILDTPVTVRQLVQNIELVHRLNINQVGINTQHYGLDFSLLTNVDFFFPALRTTMTHEFNFLSNDLEVRFASSPYVRAMLRQHLHMWFIAIVRQPPPRYQIWVCVSDRSRVRDINREVDARNDVANNRLRILASRMLNTDMIGAVFRLR